MQQLDTIDGKNWGFDAGLYIGTVFHTARTIQASTGEDACIFIVDNAGDAADLNIFIQLDEDDMDSTDFNPFRQYARLITNTLEALLAIDEIAEHFHGKQINYIDREAVNKYKFVRVL